MGIMTTDDIGYMQIDGIRSADRLDIGIDILDDLDGAGDRGGLRNEPLERHSP